MRIVLDNNHFPSVAMHPCVMVTFPLEQLPPAMMDLWADDELYGWMDGRSKWTSFLLPAAHPHSVQLSSPSPQPHSPHSIPDLKEI
jgi:hypothetical protein